MTQSQQVEQTGAERTVTAPMTGAHIVIGMDDRTPCVLSACFITNGTSRRLACEWVRKLAQRARKLSVLTWESLQLLRSCVSSQRPGRST